MFTRTQLKVVELARKYVHKCDAMNKSLHVTLIMHGSFLVSYGVNNEGAYFPNANGYIHNSIHSEFDALRRFRRKSLIGEIGECDVYNVRISRRNELKMARPCHRCESLLMKHPPRRVFYTNDCGVFIPFFYQDINQWLKA